jgi:hypothetical protein
MKPYACHNRQPFKRTLTVQDGYKDDGTRNMVDVPFTMSPLCDYTTSELGKVDVRCAACKHRITHYALLELAQIDAEICQ